MTGFSRRSRRDRPRNRFHVFLAVVGLLSVAASLTVFVTRTEDGPLPTGRGAATRDPLQQPFASWSIWNLPIGSGARYRPANIKDWTTHGVFLEEIYVFNNAPGSVPADVVGNMVGWGEGSRCPENWPRLWGLLRHGNIFGGVRLRLPPDFTIADRHGPDTPNNPAAILSPDGRQYYQTQPLTHCTNGGPWTALPYNYTIVDVDGDGIEGDQGGSGLSSIGGTIRVGEWRTARAAGTFRHALKTVLDPDNYGRGIGPDCWFPGCRWPAVTSDCSGLACGYAGGSSHAHLKMGSLLALAPRYDCASLRTEPGRILCQTLKDYGMYVVDSGWDPAYLPVERGPAGFADQEFRTEFGFDMEDGDPDSRWSQDWRQIVTSTHVVDNWDRTLYEHVRMSGGALGAGGGTPRVPWAPDPCLAPSGGGVEERLGAGGRER
jgi:hypothetical protein